MSSFRITQGFTEAERSIVAPLFWEALVQSSLLVSAPRQKR